MSREIIILPLNQVLRRDLPHLGNVVEALPYGGLVVSPLKYLAG